MLEDVELEAIEVEVTDAEDVRPAALSGATSLFSRLRQRIMNE